MYKKALGIWAKGATHELGENIYRSYIELKANIPGSKKKEHQQLNNNEFDLKMDRELE